MADSFQALVHLWCYGDPDRGVGPMTSVRALADTAGVDPTTVSAWAHGQSTPLYTTWLGLA